ncbi:MAG: N-acetylglucosamine malate deacetylase 1 [Abditibacteriota bacterium]|nr:N-acetylglucosamine malate deacetylase 1 [Abditibacteriota bacterium]
MQTPNQRVLAVMPHPDDVEILCAGTLLRLQEKGYEIHIATMTAGDKGSATLSRAEIAAIRREEVRRAAAELGAASYRCLEFADLEIVFDNAARRKVAGLLRAVDPFLVFTTPPHDYMFDHEITSRLVRDACFNAGVPNYKADTPDAQSEGKVLSQMPYLFYSDAIEGHDIFGDSSRVTTIVDISPHIEQKAAALCCHDSQRSWLQRVHGMDNYIESMKNWSAKRGAAIGVAYAEAFCQHLGHPHPQDDVLCSLLNAVSQRAAQ